MKIYLIIFLIKFFFELSNIIFSPNYSRLEKGKNDFFNSFIFIYTKWIIF